MNLLTQVTSLRRRPVRFILLALLWIIASGCTAWAFGALHFDFPVMKNVVAWGFLLAVVVAFFKLRGVWRKLAMVLASFALVLVWWLSQTPRADRDWQPDVAQLPWAEIKGDEVTLHNVRNFDYRTGTDFTPQWQTRTVRLSQITGVDMFINYWGSPWMAHPIVSFQFADAPPVCFSIETRKEVGEKYSAIGGIYRQYELYFVVADERDVIRLRTSIRPGEESYLYRMLLSPERARERFTEYVTTVNDLRSSPRWYNAITTNCTTAIRGQHPAGDRVPWDWRILVNGKADEMLYERGYIATGGLPFAELRQKSLINPAAQAAGSSLDFSRLIRAGRPGFPDATQPSTPEVPLLESWRGNFPVTQLERLPEGQRQSGVGFLADAAQFASVWSAFKPGEPPPPVDFEKNLVVFMRNTEFHNAITLGKATLKDGVLDLLAMETMSANPIGETLALALAVVPRAGVRAIQSGPTRVSVVKP